MPCANVEMFGGVSQAYFLFIAFYSVRVWEAFHDYLEQEISPCPFSRGVGLSQLNFQLSKYTYLIPARVGNG